MRRPSRWSATPYRSFACASWLGRVPGQELELARRREPGEASRRREARDEQRLAGWESGCRAVVRTLGRHGVRLGGRRSPPGRGPPARSRPPRGSRSRGGAGRASPAGAPARVAGASPGSSRARRRTRPRSAPRASGTGRRCDRPRPAACSSRGVPPAAAPSPRDRCELRGRARAEARPDSGTGLFSFPPLPFDVITASGDRSACSETGGGGGDDDDARAGAH